MRYGLFALAALGASLPAAATAQSHRPPHASAPIIRGGGSAAPNMQPHQGPARFEMHRRGPGTGPAVHRSHRRLQRGFVIPPLFSEPRFHVRNWQLYGFAPPPRDHRWVRHYDDAYLIDGGGRIRDFRYDLDWDLYGEPWDEGSDMPFDHGPGLDSDWVERNHGPYFERQGCGQCGGPVRVRVHAPPPYPSPYGYGWGPPIIVETTVTTGAPMVTTEIVEEVVETRRRPVQRHHRPRAPRPSKLVHGERG